MARRKSGLEQFIGGLGFSLVFGLLYFLAHIQSPVFLVLGIFLGLIPLVKGLSTMARERLASREDEDRRIEDKVGKVERAILSAAREHKGVVTPAIVALSSSCSLEAADKTLQSMASKGYAEMRVNDNGTIDYLFRDFQQT